MPSKITLKSFCAFSTLADFLQTLCIRVTFVIFSTIVLNTIKWEYYLQDFPNWYAKVTNDLTLSTIKYRWWSFGEPSISAGHVIINAVFFCLFNESKRLGGTFNKYVRMKIGLFDPPSPLVRKMTSLLLHSLIYWVRFWLTPPSPIQAYVLIGRSLVVILLGSRSYAALVSKCSLPPKLRIRCRKLPEPRQRRVVAILSLGWVS